MVNITRKLMFYFVTRKLMFYFVTVFIFLSLYACNDGPFDYQRVNIIGGDVIISIFNKDIDVPLRAYYFAEQQAKKHNAYFLGSSSSISIRFKSWGWSWGKTRHYRKEYTYHYKFYYKKRRSHEKISN